MGRPGEGLSYIGNDVKTIILPINDSWRCIEVSIDGESQIEDGLQMRHIGIKPQYVRNYGEFSLSRAEALEKGKCPFRAGRRGLKPS